MAISTIDATGLSTPLDLSGTIRLADNAGNKVIRIGQASPSANDGLSLEFQNANNGYNWAIRSNWNVSSALEFCPSVSIGGTTYTTPTMYIAAATGNLVFNQANSGIIFNNSSANVDSNLNDYETGTWTPVDNSGAGISFSVAYGSYVKIGKIVYVQAKILYPSTSNGSSNSVGGLPFGMSVSNPYNFPVGAVAANGNTYASKAYGTGSSFIFLSSADGTATNAQLSGANINFNFTYISTF